MLLKKTTAYRRYVDDVPKEVKAQRMNEIHKVFRQICANLNEAQIHQKQLILVEGVSN